MKEIWVDVKGSCSKYKVSNHGNVWSEFSNRLLANNPAKDGYHSVGVIFNGVRQNIGTHRLVALHFVDGYNEGLEVNHKDANKSNNRADNLEWVTHQNNMTHVRKNRLYPNTKWVCVVDEAYNILKIYNSTIECARELGLSRRRVSDCCRGFRDYLDSHKIRFYDKENNRCVKHDYDFGNKIHKGKYKKKIICIETETTAQTQAEMSDKLNINQSGISEVLRGKKKSFKGYTFKYVE